MVNNQRRIFGVWLFFGMVVPVMVAFSMRAMMPIAVAGGAGGGGKGSGAPLASIMGRTGSAAASAGATRAKDAPLRAASDGHDLWVVRPFMYQDNDNKPARGFELYRRTGNSGVWSLVGKESETFWTGFPQAISLMTFGQTAATASARSSTPGIPYVINEGGNVAVFSMERPVSTADQLPASHLVKAATGSNAGLFTITLGVPGVDGSSNTAGDRLWPRRVYSVSSSLTTRPRADTAPATMAVGLNTTAAAPATAIATTTSTAPAATRAAATATGPADVFNAYWLREGYWTVLPPLGLPSANGTSIPTTSSMLTLIADDSRVMAIWVDALEPQTIVVRTLNLSATEAQPAGATSPQSAPAWTWSPPVASHFARESIPAKSRLFGLMLDGVPYVLWSAPTGGPLTVRGGPVNADLTISENKLLPVMSLGAASDGVSPETDVAVGAVENSLVTVVLTKDNTLSTATFSARGTLLAGPLEVDPKTIHRDLQIGQNLALLMLAMVFVLSLWQWRQKPIALALPVELVAAPLTLRSLAFGIDVAIPLVIVLASFGELGTLVPVVSSWLAKIARPDELLRMPELLIVLGGYLLHVTIGELFFRRSVGKAAVGLQVLMMDGKSPTVGAILLRNLVRLPEMALGFVIFYVLISAQHQRLGDLLARTLVVSAKPPEVPEEEEEGK